MNDLYDGWFTLLLAWVEKNQDQGRRDNGDPWTHAKRKERSPGENMRDANGYSHKKEDLFPGSGRSPPRGCFLKGTFLGRGTQNPVITEAIRALLSLCVAKRRLGGTARACSGPFLMCAVSPGAGDTSACMQGCLPMCPAGRGQGNRKQTQPGTKVDETRDAVPGDKPPSSPVIVHEEDLSLSEVRKQKKRSTAEEPPEV